MIELLHLPKKQFRSITRKENAVHIKEIQEQSFQLYADQHTVFIFLLPQIFSDETQKLLIDQLILKNKVAALKQAKEQKDLIKEINKTRNNE